jgi:hypothetical protein
MGLTETGLTLTRGLLLSFQNIEYSIKKSSVKRLNIENPVMKDSEFHSNIVWTSFMANRNILKSNLLANLMSYSGVG